METPASIARHPLHPMLITIPIGLWLFSLVCDIVYLAGGSNTWAVVAFYNIAGGLVGAVIAAIAGTIDLVSLRDAHLKKMGLTHMAINIAVVILFAIGLGMRTPDIADPGGFPVVLSLAAIVLLAVSGWIGAELVHIHGVSVAGEAPAARSGAAANEPLGTFETQRNRGAGR